MKYSNVCKWFSEKKYTVFDVFKVFLKTHSARNKIDFIVMNHFFYEHWSILQKNGQIFLRFYPVNSVNSENSTL